MTWWLRTATVPGAGEVRGKRIQLAARQVGADVTEKIEGRLTTTICVRTTAGPAADYGAIRVHDHLILLKCGLWLGLDSHDTKACDQRHEKNYDVSYHGPLH
jgi:hypothetical protein